MRYILIVLAVALLSGCVKVREKPEGISGYDKALINENVDRMIEIACLSNRVTLLDARLSALESEARKARKIEPYVIYSDHAGMYTNAPVKLPVRMEPYNAETHASTTEGSR